MQIHPLEQGSPEWCQFRLTHHGASEAAAMLGLSKKATRSELLRMKHLGDSKQFNDWVQENVLNYGHEVEAMARPLAEDIIGQDLYPVTCSNELMPPWASYEMSASCDGLTMGEDIAFEHKQYNAELFVAVKACELPDEYMPQCQQIMMVTGAKMVYFFVSDGTPENLAYVVVHPDEVWQERILKGWCQFEKDLAAYQLPEAEKVMTAEPVLALPAVSVQVSGQIAVSENFKSFEVVFRQFLENDLIRSPKTDQDFVDLDSQIKEMKRAETALDAAEAQMLAQIQSVDDAKRHKDLLSKLVRDHRLMAEKLLASEKDRRRAEMIESARAMYDEHYSGLQSEIHGLRLERKMPDFAGVIKGLKTITSMQEKLDVALANGKIEADKDASDLRAKLAWVENNAGEHRALLADLQQLSVKPMEDFQMAINFRVSEHKRVEAEKLEKEREKIRKEEADRLEAEQREKEEKAQREAQVIEQKPVAPSSPQPEKQQTVITSQVKQSNSLFPDDEPEEVPTLRLGQIKERLAPITVDAEGLAKLGFPHAATEKAAKLYFESDFTSMCHAIANHVLAASNK